MNLSVKLRLIVPHHKAYFMLLTYTTKLLPPSSLAEKCCKDAKDYKSGEGSIVDWRKQIICESAHPEVLITTQLGREWLRAALGGMTSINISV